MTECGISVIFLLIIVLHLLIVSYFILSQDYLPEEIIFSDDGSEDDLSTYFYPQKKFDKRGLTLLY